MINRKKKQKRGKRRKRRRESRMRRRRRTRTRTKTVKNTNINNKIDDKISKVMTTSKIVAADKRKISLNVISEQKFMQRGSR